MMMIGLFILLVIVWDARGCPFYCGTPRANYTTFQLTQLGCLPLYPIHVCDGAVIEASDVVSPFVSNAAVIGDTVNVAAGGTQAALLTVMIVSSNPVFQVTGTAMVSFTNLMIVFNTTLFGVVDSGFLQLSYVNIYFGTVAVVVNLGTSLTTGVGFSGQFVQFASVGVAIYQDIGPIVCTGCIFNQPRLSAVSIQSPLYFNTIDITFSFWLDVPVYIYVQSAPDSPTVTPLASIPNNWGRIHNDFELPTYEPTCIVPSPSPSPTPLGGGLAGFGLPTPAPVGSGVGCHCDEGNEGVKWVKIVWLVLAVAILVAVGTISIYSRRVSQNMGLKPARE